MPDDEIEEDVNYDDDFEDEGDDDDKDFNGTMSSTRQSFSKSLSKTLGRNSPSAGRNSPTAAAAFMRAAAAPVAEERPSSRELVAGPAGGRGRRQRPPLDTSSSVGYGAPPPVPGGGLNLPPAVTRRTGPLSSQDSAQASTVSAMLNVGDDLRTGSAGSSNGGRVVRGKVSVGSDERPSTGDSGPSPQGSATAAKPAVPMWLQFGNSRPSHSSECNSLLDNKQPASWARGDGGGRGARPGSGRASRPPLSSGDHFGDRDRRAVGGVRDCSPTPRSGEPDADAERKVKRLQQEVQRLSQRLKEADLFSGQDDMLPKFTLEEVEVGCQIAQGGFSSVHHAVWRSTPCALKKIFDPVITDELRSEFENEVRMLRMLRHPHIVCLMAVCRVPPALSVLTEVIGGGSLFELLHQPSYQQRFCIKADPPSVLPVVHQAATALTYMHTMSVAHRDIKSQNVLLTEGTRPVAKLCDFGLARMVSELCTGTMQWAGTACYMAPELFAKKKYTEMVDVFAFGTMLWEVASTEIPHANMDPADIAHRVQKQDGACLPVVHSWPKSLKAALKATMAVEPDKRPPMTSFMRTLEQIMHDFPPPD